MKQYLAPLGIFIMGEVVMLIVFLFFPALGDVGAISIIVISGAFLSTIVSTIGNGGTITAVLIGSYCFTTSFFFSFFFFFFFFLPGLYLMRVVVMILNIL